MKLQLPANASSSPDPIASILRETKTIAVVGLSSNPARPSYAVARYLQSVGYRIIPVNPNETAVFNEKSYARLEDITVPVDLVDVFRRIEEIPAVAQSAINIHAKALWLQLGLEHPAAAQAALSAGLTVVEDACLLVEHKRRR